MTALTFYETGDTAIHRLNPVTKLVIALALIISGFAITFLWWAAALFLLVEIPLVIWAGVFPRFVGLIAKFVLPIIVVVFLIQGLFYPDGVTILAEWGPVQISEEGLAFAAGTSLRLLVLVGAFLFLLLTTHPGQLMTAMVQRGMPPKISYVVCSTLQIVPAFRARAQGIVQAQQARGLDTEGGFVRRAMALTPLLGPLVQGALTDVEDRSIAMEARAFGAPTRRTSLVVLPDSAAQRVTRWVLVLVAVATVVINAVGVFR